MVQAFRDTHVKVSAGPFLPIHGSQPPERHDVITRHCDKGRESTLLNTWHTGDAVANVITASYYLLTVFLGCPTCSLI